MLIPGGGGGGGGGAPQGGWWGGGGGGGGGRSHSREVCVEVSATKAFETANPVEDKNCSVCYPV